MSTSNLTEPAQLAHAFKQEGSSRGHSGRRTGGAYCQPCISPGSTDCSRWRCSGCWSGLQARECLARGQAAGRRAPEDPKAAYDHLRAAHLNAVRASLEDHVARLEWPHQRIKHYRTERLRSLLAFARERSPFHAARMADIDPATATVEDRMAAADAQAGGPRRLDAIVTTPDIDRAGAERVLAQQRWFYTSAEYRCSAQAAQAVCAVCRYGIGSIS